MPEESPPGGGWDRTGRFSQVGRDFSGADG
jgi:hypothetical protein